MNAYDRQRIATLAQSQGADQAHSLPAEVYANGLFTVLDRTEVLQRSWQLVGHQSQIPTTGDWVVHEVAEQPIIVVNTGAGIQALHNVCRHRAGPLATTSGHGKTLRCRYHGWNYHLDGRLKSAPEMHTTAGFSVADHRLPKIKTAIWQGLIFVALKDDVPPLNEVTAGIDQILAPIDLTTMPFNRRDEFIIDCNWKVYVENYLEGYHLPHVHPGLNQLLDYKSYQTQLSRWHSHQFSPLEQSEGIYGAGQAHYFFIYPNTMLNVLPNRLQTNQVLPLSHNRCRVLFDYCYAEVPDLASLIAQDQQFSDQVQAEDIGICEAVQKGLNSGSYASGPLCMKREAGLHHFQELLRAAYRQLMEAA
ncbi:aromatic ring-hydroxylating oxygenase subunit alpha [Marinicella meishanensis]|uniref:aromatic ring-hydroxylating oxygenase subunit alpha n=1 Tax=Marinicella meishanensis TaxID=2873263 RepID=UPI001CBE8C0B|nr:aromatic ring-hydroxylating dioxygenase subunit alpha [Marinicella sp. NBU2979]